MFFDVFMYTLIYFNSQPHEEADYLLENSARDIFISTHSLTKRLTQHNSDARNSDCISTHSLTKRLTLQSGQIDVNIQYFNSQPHEEADDMLTDIYKNKWNISTHSLTKRLTID